MNARTRSFLVCGILSSLLYAAMNVFVAMQWDAYSSRTMTVSELSAIGAPTRALWVTLGFIYTLLMAAFGWGVRSSAKHDRPMRMSGTFLVAYGITGLGWPLFPMHLREVLAAGGRTWSDTMHIVFTSFTVLLMLGAMGFAAAAPGKRFRIYTILTMITLATFGVLTGMEAPMVEVNGPTPWIGVHERINIGVFLVWVMVLAVALLRKTAGVGEHGRLVAIKVLHTAVWVFFNVVIFHLVRAVLTGRIDRWAWIGLGLVGVEVLVLLIFRMACPLTIVARRYSSSQEPNFDIYLPAWLARYNKVIYGGIMVGVIAGLIVRLL